MTKVDRIVRLKDIKRLEQSGKVVDYEQIEVTSIDIAKKTDKALQLKELLKQTMLYLVDKYYALDCNSEEDRDKKLDILIDIEEIIKTIGMVEGASWEGLYTRAKMGNAQTFLKHARQAKTADLRGTVEEYITYGDYDDLCYTEMALFEELKQLKSEYIKLLNKRVRKNKSQGTFRAGYYLKSIEYADKQEDKLSK